MAANLPKPSTDENISTTLSSGITDVATSMDVADASKIDYPCYLVIDRVDSAGTLKTSTLWEYVKVTNIAGNTLTITRGQSGSTGQSHGSGAVVEAVVTSAMFEDWYAVLNPEHTATGGHLISTATITTHLSLSGASITGATSPQIITGINDANGNELIKVTATASAVNEITLANAATGSGPIISATGGDTNIGLDVKMKAAGYFRKPTVVQIPAFGAATDTATGDGKAMFEVPEELAGMNITAVGAYVFTAGTTNSTTVQIRNVTQTADILSTLISIDTTEVSSRTAATPAVINTSEDDLTLGDRLAIDVDAVSTTAAKGLTVWFRAELP